VVNKRSRSSKGSANGSDGGNANIDGNSCANASVDTSVSSGSGSGNSKKKPPSPSAAEETQAPSKRAKELQLTQEEVELKGAPEGAVYEVAVLHAEQIEPSNEPDAEIRVSVRFLLDACGKREVALLAHCCSVMCCDIQQTTNKTACVANG